MDKQFALRMADAIETLYLEKIALRSLIKTLHPSYSFQQIDELVHEAANHPELKEIAHSQLKTLRDRLESDSDLEAAIQALLKVSPPSNDIN